MNMRAIPTSTPIIAGSKYRVLGGIITSAEIFNQTVTM